MSGILINYADMNGNSSSGFSCTLDFEQMHPKIHQTIQQAWDFFGSVPYYKLKPHQEIVDKGFCRVQPDNK